MASAEPAPAPAPAPESGPAADDQAGSPPVQSAAAAGEQVPTPPTEPGSRADGRPQDITKDQSEQRQIEIVKAIVCHNNGQIFELGQKKKVLEACIKPLNTLDVFAGTLKFSTLESLWRKAEKAAEEILADEERFVKLAQNGGKDLSELDSLIYNLARCLKQHRDTKQQQKDVSEANAKDAQSRLKCALSAQARRCGYNSVAQAEKLLNQDFEGGGEPNADESPKPEDFAGAGNKRSPSNEIDDKQQDGGPSNGRGQKEGQNKLAKPDPVLRPDRAISEDPLASLATRADKLFGLLEQQGKSDGDAMAQIAKAQKMAAQAEKLKQAAAAAEAFVKAKQSGIELPPGLMAMFNGDD